MVVWGIGSYLCSTAHDAGTLAGYRFLLGLGMGMELPLAATLLSEFIPSDRRGRLLALMDGNWPVAFICAGTISYVVLPTLGWRAMFVIGAVPALFVLVLRRAIPESPRWLEARDRHAEADAIVAAIESKVMRSAGVDRLPEVTARPMAPATMTGGLPTLFSRAYRTRAAVVAGLWFFALLGFYGLDTWIGAIVQRSGTGVARSVLFTVWISLGGVPGFACAALAVDRIGRKSTCIGTLLGGAVATFVFGRVLGTAEGDVAAVAAGVTMQFFLFGMWAVLYAYTPELFPSRARASACGFASFCGRIGALIGPTAVGVILPLASNAGVFALGASCFCLAALIVAVGGIETRAMTLEAISD